MGNKGVWDRLRQIKPKWVVLDDASVYDGKTVELRGKMGGLWGGDGEGGRF